MKKNYQIQAFLKLPTYTVKKIKRMKESSKDQSPNDYFKSENK
jgi:hypothetical protein